MAASLHLDVIKHRLLATTSTTEREVTSHASAIVRGADRPAEVVRQCHRAALTASRLAFAAVKNSHRALIRAAGGGRSAARYPCRGDALPDAFSVYRRRWLDQTGHGTVLLGFPLHEFPMSRIYAAKYTRPRRTRSPLPHRGGRRVQQAALQAAVHAVLYWRTDHEAAHHPRR